MRGPDSYLVGVLEAVVAIQYEAVLLNLNSHGKHRLIGF